MKNRISKGAIWFGLFSWTLLLVLGLIWHHSKNREIVASTSIRNSMTMDKVKTYTLQAKNGIKVEILNLGGVLQRLWVPTEGGEGEPVDVVLGFDELEPYMDGRSMYMGSIVGRVANRIAQGKFTINGITYNVNTNDNGNCLHGGIIGFDRKIWDVVEGTDATLDNSPYVELKYSSPDGEEGFPGEVDATVRYTLVGKGELRINFSATSSSPTPISLTNHAYFNLGGHASGPIDQQQLWMDAAYYTPVDANLIPTGEILEVKNTPYDYSGNPSFADIFSSAKPPATGIDNNLVLFGLGPDVKDYVHNGVVSINGSSEARPAARVTDPISGRTLEVCTTSPGLQVYTGDGVVGVAGKKGAVYDSHHSVCLEAQHFPDSVNQDAFPDMIIQDGQTYLNTIIFKFGW